jgi:hypothetical protein
MVRGARLHGIECTRGRLAPMRSIPVGYSELATMNQNQSKCPALFLGDLDVWGILSQRFYTLRK